MINNSMMRAALSIAAVAVGFGSGSAVAQESSSTRFFQGLYLSGAIGAHQTDDADLSGIGINVSNDTDWGPAALLAIGLELGDTNWRTELEGGYRDADVDSISGVSGSGDVEALSFVGNIFYDIPVSGNFELYLGGGLGIGFVDYDGVAPVGAATADETDFGWIWQVGAGAALALNDRTKLTLDYRFLNIEDVDIATTPSIGEVEANYQDHGIFIGLRFLLNEPAKQMAAPKPPPKPVVRAPAPPPPPPPPAPEPPQNFIVFFDWDQSVITAEALAILRDAATAALRGGPVRIVATGHADRSGASDYNRGLSERRATAVRDQLELLGVNPSTVSTFARGETDPLVSTPDGVREPQNRRVELVLQ